MRRLGLTIIRLTRGITQVNWWCIIPCQYLAWNSVHEVNPKVKVNLLLANPWINLDMEQLTLSKVVMTGIYHSVRVHCRMFGRSLIRSQRWRRWCGKRQTWRTEPTLRMRSSPNCSGKTMPCASCCSLNCRIPKPVLRCRPRHRNRRRAMQPSRPSLPLTPIHSVPEILQRYDLDLPRLRHLPKDARPMMTVASLCICRIQTAWIDFAKVRRCRCPYHQDIWLMCLLTALRHRLMMPFHLLLLPLLIVHHLLMMKV